MKITWFGEYNDIVKNNLELLSKRLKLPFDITSIGAKNSQYVFNNLSEKQSLRLVSECRKYSIFPKTIVKDLPLRIGENYNALHTSNDSKNL